MILRITDSTEDFDLGTYKVSLSNFASKTYHPMIATTKWDVVYIDVTDETPRGIISQLIGRMRIIPIFDKENVTPKMLQVLCEIMPDESAKLRVAYMKDKWAFKELIMRFEEERWRI